MKSVLIVEDNPLNMELVVQLLEDDYALLTAENGAEGLEIMRSERPDLVLLDLSMPVMDGWQVLDAVRADPVLATTPIVVLSAHAMTSDRERAIAAGAADFMTKPVDEDLLFDLVARYLS